MDRARMLDDHFKGLGRLIESIPDDSPIKDMCKSFHEDAVREQAELRISSGPAYDSIETFAFSLANVATGLGVYYSGCLNDLREQAGLDRAIANEISRLYARVAVSHAEQIWAADKDKEYRIGDMTKTVMDIMKREGMTRQNVEGSSRLTFRVVKGWITPVAPEYARKPGRPKK